MPNQMISIEEFCRRSNLGRSTFYKLKNNNSVKWVKAGSRTLVLESSVDEFLEKGGKTQCEEE